MSDDPVDGDDHKSHQRAGKDNPKPYEFFLVVRKRHTMGGLVQDVRTLWIKQDPEMLEIAEGLRKLTELMEEKEERVA